MTRRIVFTTARASSSDAERFSRGFEGSRVTARSLSVSETNARGAAVDPKRASRSRLTPGAAADLKSAGSRVGRTDGIFS